MLLFVAITHVMLPPPMYSLSPLLHHQILPFQLFIISIKLSPTFNLSSVSIMFTPEPESRILTFPIASPSDITQISFDLIINFLAPVLLNQGYHTLQHFIYESNLL